MTDDDPDRAAELAQALTAIPAGHVDDLREWLAVAFPDTQPTTTDIERWQRWHYRRDKVIAGDRVYDSVEDFARSLGEFGAAWADEQERRP